MRGKRDTKTDLNATPQLNFGVHIDEAMLYYADEEDWALFPRAWVIRVLFSRPSWLGHENGPCAFVRNCRRGVIEFSDVDQVVQKAGHLEREGRPWRLQL